MKRINQFFLISLMLALILLTSIYITKHGKNESASYVPANGQSRLYFEQNKGQFNREVLYLLKSKDHNVFVTEDDLVMTFNDSRKTLKYGKTDQLLKHQSKVASSNSYFRMRFQDPDPERSIEAMDRCIGESNYFKGNDAGKWVTHAPHFGKVAYRNVYQGIDLELYGNEDRFEYDFIVKPQADPETILMNFEGVDRMSVNTEGDLVLTIDDQIVKHHKPLAYQEVDGVTCQVESHFVIKNENLVTFNVGEYNPEYPLVIDPVVTYSTYVGTEGWDQGHHITTDKQGNMYLVGWTDSPDFPVTAGAYDIIHGPDVTNNFDLFPSPNALVFSPISGGYSVVAGNNTIDPVFGPQVTFTGDPNITLYPYDDDYAEVNLSFSFPFQGQTYNTIFVNSDGNITFGSGTTTTNRSREDMIFGPPRIAMFYWDLAPIIFGFGTVHADVRPDRVVVTYSDVPAFSGDYTAISAPNTFQAILHLDGTIEIIFDQIDLDYGCITGISDGPATGTLLETDLSMADGSFSGSSIFEVFNNGNTYQQDAFIMKFNTEGELIWSTFLGGGTGDVGHDICLDADNNVYVLLMTASYDLPLSGGLSRPYSGWISQPDYIPMYDTYVAKLSSDGSNLLFGTYIGGTGKDLPSNLVLDKSNNVYIAGVTESADFLDGETPLITGAYPVYTSGIQPFVVKLDEDASLVSYTFFPANTFFAYPNQTKGIELDPDGNVILTGTDDSGNAPTTPGAFQPLPQGGGDVFIARLNQDLSQLMACTYLGGSDYEYGSEFTIDKKGEIYITSTTYSDDFPVTDQAFCTERNGGEDCVVSKLSSSLGTLCYSTYIGGSGDDVGRAIVVHNSGEAFIAGQTLSSDFPVTPDAFDNSQELQDLFLVRLDKKGSRIKYSTFIGGDGYEYAHAICLSALDGYGEGENGLRISLTGLSLSDNFPTTPNAFDGTYGGQADAFITNFLFGDEKNGDRDLLAGLSEDFPEQNNSLTVYPNPLRDQAVIEFTLKEESTGVVAVYNSSGVLIEEVTGGTFSEGLHQIRWVGGNLPGGVYYIRLMAGNDISTAKVLISD